MKPRVVALLALLACDFAAAQAYKWVDENGRTHFSDTPPPERKADKVKIRPQAPADPQAVARQPDWKTQLQESNMRNAQAQADQDAAERDRKLMERNCSAARSQLEAMQTSRVFRRDEKGEKHYLEDKDRPAAIAAAQEQVSKYCR